MKIIKLDVQDGKGEIDVAVADIFSARRVEQFFQWSAKISDERDELSDLLVEIGNFAHDNSTGPENPDALWEVREMAYKHI